MERAAETHVQLVTPAGTLIADVALRPDDTLHELYRLGCANSSFDSTCVLRFQLLDAHANPLQHDGLVRDNVKDGDSVTFVAIARDWMGAVKRNPATLRCAPQFARADPLVVLEAVRQRGAVLAYAAPELQDKRDVVFAAVSTDGRALEFASAKLRDDKDIVLAAVCHQGPALRFASERLRSDREVVTCACVNDGNSLEYAMNWRRDKAMVLLAVERHQALDRQSRSPIQFAAPELLGNYDFMWQAAQLDRCCVDFAAADIRPVLRTTLEESLDKDHGFHQVKVPLTELKFRSERSTAPGAEDSESESDGDGSVYSI